MFYCGEIDLSPLLHAYGLKLAAVAEGETIPGSFWGESEAGLIGNTLYVRKDTPVHSALHEACHWICMDEERRTALHTDAGGDVLEEAGVCYLQVLLADEISPIGRDRLMKDMDEWGYSFRLGSTRAWFQEDAEDALAWLKEHELVDEHDRARIGAIVGRQSA